MNRLHLWFMIIWCWCWFQQKWLLRVLLISFIASWISNLFHYSLRFKTKEQDNRSIHFKWLQEILKNRESSQPTSSQTKANYAINRVRKSANPVKCSPTFLPPVFLAFNWLQSLWSYSIYLVSQVGHSLSHKLIFRRALRHTPDDFYSRSHIAT